MSQTQEHAQALGLTFKNIDLLTEALTHRSYLNENKTADKHNERLEFLGDAVLELASTHFLFTKFPSKPEGDLTAYRAALVNTVSLAESARLLGLNDMLQLSKGEAKDTGRARDIILANAYEAVLGALYLDQGYKPTTKFIKDNICTKLPDIIYLEEYQS